MAQITLSKDAPKGEEVTVSFGATTFTLSSDAPYTTDDPVVVDEARRHSLLEVKDDESNTAKTAAAEAKAADEAYAARDAYKRALATKNPLDPAPTAPFEVAQTPSGVEPTDSAVAEEPKPKKAADKAKEEKD